MTLHEMIGVAAGGAAGGGMGGLGLWMLKRWMVHTDKRFDRLQAAIQKLAEEASKLHTAVAVSHERQSNLTGRLDQLAKSVETTHKDVGQLAASIQKLWLVLKSKDMVPKRFSDEAIEG